LRPEYASRLAASWLAADEPVPWRELDATAVLADVTGFTRLTEILAARGGEGAEVLHRTLTLCLTTLLGPSIDAGGDIVGFAGDAALVLFDGDDHARRAARAGLAMLASLALLPASITGGRRLRVSIGIHTGTFTAVLTRSSQRALLFCGPAVDELVTLQSSADAGQVVVGGSTAGQLPTSWIGAPVAPGFALRRRTSSEPIPRAQPAPVEPLDPVSAERCLALLSPSVRDLMTAEASVGEHHTASIGFVAVPGLDAILAAGGPAAAFEALDDVTTTVTRIAGELGVAWLDSDVGVGTVKLLLAAGAPQAVDDDEGRLLLALRRMLDESHLPLRAGAQRGRVFAGALGVPGRRGFTVIGDAANVAARALGLAGAGELVVGDGLGVSNRASVSSVPLGPMTLKNRLHPVALYRVTAVKVPPAAPGQWRSGATVSRVGRARERRLVANAWALAMLGQGAAWAVVGEPGMGASDLLAEASDLAGAAGMMVVADGYRSTVPYGTVTSVVQSLAYAAGAPASDPGWSWLGSHVEAIAPAIGLWLDDGRKALARQPTSGDVDPESSARRARAVIVALLRAAAPRPWLLAVDNLDDVDDASRLVLADLRDVCADEPWLVLTSARPGGASLAARADPATTIDLGPLDADEAVRFVLDVDPLLRDDQVERVVAAGNGNPFVLAELARHADVPDLPDSLERLGAARVDALPIAVRGLVRDTAVFGQTFDLAAVSEVLGRPELAAESMWEPAGSVLRPAAPGQLAFRHEAYRLAAYASLPFQRRRELHGAIADHLAAGRAPDDVVIARHQQEAGRLREAFPRTVAAARSARASGALVEAGELLARAVQMARDVDRSALGDLLAEQADVLMRIGDQLGTDRALAAAGRATTDGLASARLCSQRADVAIVRSRYRQARRWVQRGLTITRSLGAPALEVHGKLLLDEAAALHYQGQNDDSLRLAGEALEAALQTGSRLLEGLAHLHLEMAYSVLLRPEAREHGDAAVVAFEAIGHDRHLANALGNSGLTEMMLGHWDEALIRYRRARVAGIRTGDTRLTAGIDLNEGFLLVRLGRYAEAEAIALPAQRRFDTGGFELFSAYARHLRSQVAAGEGRFDDATGLMTEARARFLHLGDTTMVADCDVVSVGQLLAAGRPADALALAASVEGSVAATEESVQASFAVWHGLALAQAGRIAEGVQRVTQGLDTARQSGLPYEMHRALSALVEVEDAGGPAAPHGARRERDALAAQLGLPSTDDLPGSTSAPNRHRIGADGL
jgi:class 3 adenylate cyclase/tetratricopeptide (TPR) repeat protein